MSSDHAGRPAQFTQSTLSNSTQVDGANERTEAKNLHAHYKPVGISAVSAAAHFTEKAKKKP
jgi:hypothetical protein